MKRTLPLLLLSALVASAAAAPFEEADRAAAARPLGMNPVPLRTETVGRRAVEWFEHDADPAWGGAALKSQLAVAKPVGGDAKGAPLLVILHARGGGRPDGGIVERVKAIDEKGGVYAAPDGARSRSACRTARSSPRSTRTSRPPCGSPPRAWASSARTARPCRRPPRRRRALTRPCFSTGPARTTTGAATTSCFGSASARAGCRSSASFRWKALADEARGVAMELWIESPGTLGTKQFAVPETATADVTLRRVSVRRPAPGRRYAWVFGTQKGTVQVGPDGLLTIPGLSLTRAHTRLLVQPAK